MMGDLAKDVALGAAARVARTMGPSAGLVAYRTLAEGSSDSETRGIAILEAIGCALALRDEGAMGGLVGLYAGVKEGRLDARARATVLALERLGFGLAARGLAALELERFPRARTAYVLARCFVRARAPSAASALERARSLAATEGDRAVAASSGALLALHLHGVGREVEARAVEKALTLADVPPELLLALSDHGLVASSRFVRAAWLGELDRLVSGAAPRIADAALARVCAHADRHRDTLTALELDRVLAVFAKLRDEALSARLSARVRSWPRLVAAAAREPVVREEVLAVLAEASPSPRTQGLAMRALDLATGRFEPKTDLPKDPENLIFSAAFALRDGDGPRASTALSAWAERSREAHVGALGAAWEVTRFALSSEDEAVRRAACACARALVERAAPLPSGSGLAIARSVRLAGEMELAARLLAMAVAAKEPLAKETFGDLARELGWKAALEGRRDEAIRHLRAARDLGQ